MSSKDAEDEKTQSDSEDDHANPADSMVESSKQKKLKMFSFVTEGVIYVNLIHSLNIFVPMVLLMFRFERRMCKCNQSKPTQPSQLGIYRVDQNLRVQNIRNQNGLIGVPRNANQNGNDNLIAARAEGNATGHNADLDEIEEVNANCILMVNLQQVTASGTQTDKAPLYDSDGSAEVHNYEDCYEKDIFNMFTQEEQYTELLEPILESHQVPHNNNVISKVTSAEQSEETVEQHPANVEETQAAKFVGDFKSLAKEVDESLAKRKALELEIERLLRAVVSQDIMSVMQHNSVGETSNLQIKLERTKERFENCIIKKENEYAKFWNDWYKKCEECKFDKISYDKAYNDMQQKIKQLQAQLGELKGKITSNSIPTPQESKVVKNDKVIAPGMFRINPFKTSMEEKHVPNTVREISRTKPITISQPPVITKKVVNSDSNGLSSTTVDKTKTRRP
nr:hypothetical protein [Tanacetum cinerariifolium]